MYTLVDESVLRDFYAGAAPKVSALRRLFAEAGVAWDALPTLDEWLVKVPVTSKDDLSRRQAEQPPFGGWVPDDLAGVLRVFVSPGPIYNVEGTDADDWGAAEAFRAAGFGRGDLVVNTFTYHLSPASFIVEEALAALGGSVLPAGTLPRSELAALLKHLPITGFVGLPSYLRAVLNAVREEAEQAGQAPPSIPLRRAWFTAEKLDDEFRDELASLWGVAGRQGYGTAELGVVAYECEQADGLHLSGHVVVEVLDPETREPVAEGDVGELVITSLRGAYPLLRLGTGDLSRVHSTRCPCGRPGPMLAGVLGRVGAGVKVRGMFVYPHQIEQLAASVPGVLRIAATVGQRDGRDELFFDVEADGSAPADVADRLAGLARERLRVRVDVVRVHPEGSLENDAVLTDARSD